MYVVTVIKVKFEPCSWSISFEINSENISKENQIESAFAHTCKIVQWSKLQLFSTEMTCTSQQHLNTHTNYFTRETFPWNTVVSMTVNLKCICVIFEKLALTCDVFAA